MDDHPSTPPGRPEDPELLSIEADYPGWVAWRGVGGLLYARRVKSSPPKVVRAPDIGGLRAAIEARGGKRRP